ncbi:GABA permease [Cordyceps javanica]|uniref:GABA permease n=1 Tax=Cordyceps javanica TaxID=43265 RepID=A0A545VMP7_9HYPO|nr:GABA permease [Cordyceps javanica]TQW02971.1 GABA permease [Cordyceps javanica]
MMLAEPSRSNAAQLVTSVSIGSSTAASAVMEVEQGRRSSGGDKATRSNRADVENMRRMGRSQELVRNFRMFSMASFAAMATASWEFGVFQMQPGLVDGGRPGLLYSSLWGFVGFLPIYLSMAEMASMAPIAGAQYHWVSEFAPRSMQKVLSYVSGWTSTLALQAGNALGILLVGSLIQTIIVVNVEDYTAPAWHASLFVIVTIGFAFTGSVVGHGILHYWQNMAFAIHVMVYFAILIPIWVNAPEATHSQVWTQFENRGDWNSMALSILIGQLPGITCHAGVDAAAHMSEEVRNASTAVPQAMLITFAINFALLFPMIVTAVYHMPDLTPALDDATSFPFIYVLRQTMTTGWLTVTLVAIVTIFLGSNIAYLTATSRDLYAFARDDGLPFSNWLSQVSKRHGVPQNAAITTSAISFLLALIYVGSSVAFYAITSLFTVAVLQCYVLGIACVLWRRITYPQTLPHAPFSLGRWGVPINISAVVFGTWGFFWAFWPQVYPVTGDNFNWASPLFLITVIGALINYAISGRKKYFGPVALVDGRKDE